MLRAGRYISEVVLAIHSPELLCKLKPADVPGLVQLCVVFHTRYATFTGELVSATTS